jgi:transposase InsO family protein
MARQRQTFTREFKAGAVRRITEQGRSLAEVARGLDLSATMLRSWKQALATDGERAFPGKGNPPAVEEELRRLRAEREILNQPGGRPDAAARDRRQDEAEVPPHDRPEPRPPRGRGPRGPAVRAGGGRSRLGGRYPVHPDPRGVAVPGGRGGPALATDRRLVDALEMAIAQRLPGEGLVARSDRGSRYASEHSQRLPARHRIACSMSRRGGCWDNAPVGWFFASLKKGLVHGADFATRAEARAALFEYVEVFYNRVWRHSALGYLSPEEFERAG